MNVRELSVEEYDALVDEGKIVAWTADEGTAISRENLTLRSRKGGPLSGRAADNSGELREACRKILAYKLKRPPSRKPRSAGMRSAGSAWDA